MTGLSRGPERLPQQFRGPLVQRAEGRVQVMQDRPAERRQGGRRRAGRTAGQVEGRISGSRVDGLLHVTNLLGGPIPADETEFTNPGRRQLARRGTGR